jgi:hypothetical protein
MCVNHVDARPRHVVAQETSVIIQERGKVIIQEKGRKKGEGRRKGRMRGEVMRPSLGILDLRAHGDGGGTVELFVTHLQHIIC